MWVNPKMTRGGGGNCGPTNIFVISFLSNLSHLFPVTIIGIYSCSCVLCMYMYMFILYILPSLPSNIKDVNGNLLWLSWVFSLVAHLHQNPAVLKSKPILQ